MSVYRLQGFYHEEGIGLTFVGVVLRGELQLLLDAVVMGTHCVMSRRQIGHFSSCIAHSSQKPLHTQDGQVQT